MVETYLRRSPLAHKGLPARARADAGTGDAGVLLAERPHRCQVNLRGDPADEIFIAAVRGAIGVEPPLVPNTTAAAGDLKALWLGPNEWLIVGPDGREKDLAAGLRAALAGSHAAVVDVSEARTVISVSGPRVRDLMAKGTGLDLHPRVFGPGACAQAGMAKTGMILVLTDEAPTFELYVLDSFADYLWTWLEEAGREYGIAVVE